MAITVFGTPQSAADTNAAHSTIAISLPNGGQVISAPTLVVLTGGLRGGTPTFSTPASYTSLLSVNDGNSNALYVFYQNYASGVTLPASITLTAGGTWTYAGATSIAYQGHNSASPIDGVGVSTTNASGTPFAATGITTTGTNERVVWAYHVRGGVTGGSPAVSLGAFEIQVTPAALGGDGYMAVADLTQAASGASGSNSLSYLGSAVNNMALTFAIQQAAAGGGGNSSWLTVNANNALRGVRH